MSFFILPTTLVSAAESRRFAAKKIKKTKAQRQKRPRLPPKCRNPVQHFGGAVKNIEFFNSPFYFYKASLSILTTAAP